MIAWRDVRLTAVQRNELNDALAEDLPRGLEKELAGLLSAFQVKRQGNRAMREANQASRLKFAEGAKLARKLITLLRRTTRSQIDMDLFVALSARAAAWEEAGKTGARKGGRPRDWVSRDLGMEIAEVLEVFNIPVALNTKSSFVRVFTLVLGWADELTGDTVRERTNMYTLAKESLSQFREWKDARFRAGALARSRESKITKYT